MVREIDATVCADTTLREARVLSGGSVDLDWKETLKESRRLRDTCEDARHLSEGVRREFKLVRELVRRTHEEFPTTVEAILRRYKAIPAPKSH